MFNRALLTLANLSKAALRDTASVAANIIRTYGGIHNKPVNIKTSEFALSRLERSMPKTLETVEFSELQ